MDGTGKIKLPVENSCPVCQKPLKRFTQGQARYIGCASCSSWLTVDKKGVISKTNSKPLKWNPQHQALKIGAKAKFDGKDFILISAVEKADSHASQFTWREYTLFHPVNGYTWISEFDGHWMRLRQIPAPYRLLSGKFMYEGREFNLFQQSRSIVKAAVGEFPDNLHGKSVSYTEYISPPFLISYEGSKKYNACFLGEYNEPEAIAEAFGIDSSKLPERVGVGAVQPRKAKFQHQSLINLFGLCAGLLILIQTIFVMSAEEKEVANIYQTGSDSLAVVSKPFILTDHSSNLEFYYHSNVSNNWSEADIMLVNDQTGEMRGLTMGVEYYSGYDGESWSEGGTESDAIFSSVAPGVYHLNIKAIHGSSGSGGDEFTLRVVNDVPVWSNLVIVFFLLLIFPAINWWRERQFEKSRWENSDYSPFHASE